MNLFYLQRKAKQVQNEQNIPPPVTQAPIKEKETETLIQIPSATIKQKIIDQKDSSKTSNFAEELAKKIEKCKRQELINKILENEREAVEERKFRRVKEKKK